MTPPAPAPAPSARPGPDAVRPTTSATARRRRPTRATDTDSPPPLPPPRPPRRYPPTGPLRRAAVAAPAPAPAPAPATVHPAPGRPAPAPAPAQPRPAPAPAPVPVPAALSPSQVAWLGVLPAVAVLVLAGVFVARPLGERLVQAGDRVFLPSLRPIVRPEPLDLARYLLAAAASGLLAVWVLVATRRPARRSPARPGLRLAVLASQALALVLVAASLVAQTRLPLDVTPTPRYFQGWTLLLASAAGAAVAILAVRRRLPVGGLPATSRLRHPAVGLALAAAVTAVWLLPAVFTDTNLGRALLDVRYHYQFTTNEFLPVLNGRSPLVNFVPQYSGLLPYLMAPVLLVVGTSVTAFTTLMAGLTLVALLAVYGVFAAVTGNWRSALLLYLPFLAVTLYAVRSVGDERFFLANYYAVLPLRYVGPFVLALLCARHLAGHTPRRPVALFVVAGFVAVNNPDFGLPALIATTAAVWCASRRTDIWKPAGTALARAGFGLAVALTAIGAFAFVRTGSMPRVNYLFYWSRSYALGGFYMLPMPAISFHLVVFATFAAALATALVRRSRQAPERVLTGMLAWSGVFGTGAFAYFVGRSHPTVLIAVFGAWGLAVALLAWCLLSGMATGPARRRPPEWALLPGLAVLFGFGLMVATVIQVPAPWTQVARIARPGPSAVWDRTPAVEFVREVADPGDKVAILDPMGHGVARRAGVVDVSPYSSPLVIATPSQLDEVLAALRREGGDTVFTGPYAAPEVPAHLRAAGFVRTRTDRRPKAETSWLTAYVRRD